MSEPTVLEVVGGQRAIVARDDAGVVVLTDQFRVDDPGREGWENSWEEGTVRLGRDGAAALLRFLASEHVEVRSCPACPRRLSDDSGYYCDHRDGPLGNEGFTLDEIHPGCPAIARGPVLVTWERKEKP